MPEPRPVALVTGASGGMGIEIARELSATHRVRIVTVAPGQTDTPMLRSMIPADRYRAELYIRPRSIAEVVRFAVDAPADVQLTDLAVRPRQEIARL